jgi:streptogramin lyase
MLIQRRAFIATMVGGVMAAGRTRAQGEGAPVKAREVKVEKLYKAPDAHPNALEAEDDGLWIGDQISEHVAKVDWETGKVLHEMISESHNTSGLAVGGGYLWLNANGGGSAAQMRPPRPTDKTVAETIKADLKTGKIVKSYRAPWSGGIHGATYVRDTDRLWSVAVGISALVERDTKDELRITRIIPVRQDAPHGIAWQEGGIWCLAAADRIAQKLDPDSGRVLDAVKLGPQDPDPHGMCIYKGYMYYCDAGLGGGRTSGGGSAPGYICRFKL